MIIKKSTLKIKNQQVRKHLNSEIDSIFFDIETTGLSWKTSHLYLIGAIYNEDGIWILKQWFLDLPFEESALLEAFSELCSTKKKLIHYNGTTFDLPYLRHKYLFYQLSDPTQTMENLDLYQKVKKAQPLLRLSSLRLTDLVAFLQIERKDNMSGKELIPLYTEYLTCCDTVLLEHLLLHNKEDVCNLLDILPLLDYEKLMDGSVQYISFRLDTNCLYIEFQTFFSAVKPISAAKGPILFEYTDTAGSLKIQGQETVMKHFFSDYKNYYYLPLEDQAIHKSIGIYVDSDHREQAKARTCFQKSNGLFFFQPVPRLDPVFYNEYHKDSYFRYQEDLFQDHSKLRRYFSDCLHWLFKSNDC